VTFVRQPSRGRRSHAVHSRRGVRSGAGPNERSGAFSDDVARDAAMVLTPDRPDPRATATLLVAFVLRLVWPTLVSLLGQLLGR
jgi:hypothetical protein